MHNKHIHIISFDIPFPANYGGVIDVFYKIKALFNKGIKIHLHCFLYGNRKPSEDLAQYCETVHYYNRTKGLSAGFSIKPYIVKSRSSKQLLKKLLKDDYPILFEGIHSCYHLKNKKLKTRLKIYRESNIEHHYYYHLCLASRNIFKKLFYFSESIKLLRYQSILKHANIMLAVSKMDEQYLKCRFPQNKIYHLPCFHGNETVSSQPSKGYYALYHGKLSVEENEKVAIYLIKEVFDKINYPLIIAGENPSKYLIKLQASNPKVQLIANPSETEMFDLVQNAQINLMLTFQATGLKLKLLNSLYQGKFCICNTNMLSGSPLPAVCSIADTTEELKKEIMRLSKETFSQQHFEKQKKYLEEYFSITKNTKQLLTYLTR